MAMDPIDNGPQMARLQPNSPNDLQQAPKAQEDIEAKKSNEAEERRERERMQKRERIESTPPPREEGRGEQVDVYA